MDYDNKHGSKTVIISTNRQRTLELASLAFRTIPRRCSRRRASALSIFFLASSSALISCSSFRKRTPLGIRVLFVCLFGGVAFFLLIFSLFCFFLACLFFVKYEQSYFSRFFRENSQIHFIKTSIETSVAFCRGFTLHPKIRPTHVVYSTVASVR